MHSIEPDVLPSAELALWVGAARHHLARPSSSTATFVQLLRHQWPNLSERARSIIRRDVDEALDQADDGGSWLVCGRQACESGRWEAIRSLWERDCVTA